MTDNDQAHVEFTSRSPREVDAMEFIGDTPSSGHATMLTARLRENGTACLTLRWDKHNTWSIELTYEQRVALSRFFNLRYPVHFRRWPRPE